MIRLLLLLLAASLCACDDEGPLPPAINQCFSDSDCKRPAKCHPTVFKCTRENTAEPYKLIVRVSVPPSSVPADAGLELVPEVEHDLGSLESSRDAEVLTVPEAVPLTGRVTEMDGGEVASLLHAQVTIVARDAEVPIAAHVIETRSDEPLGDGGIPANLNVRLDPKPHYDVRVLPLSAASSRLPPFTLTDVAADQSLILEAPSVEPRVGRFIYRDEMQRAVLVRLEEKGTGRVLSSTAQVKAEESTSTSGEKRREGLFTLYANPDVLAMRNFDLVISLGGHAPWQVTITIDGERFLAGGDMFLPAAPSPVKVTGVVEDQRRQRLTESVILFVSSYLSAPPPDPDPPKDAGAQTPTTEFGADWCRWQDPARVTCRGRFQTLADEKGDFSIELIPGRYEVFILPRDSARTRDVIVTRYIDDSNPDKPLLLGEGAGMTSLILQANVATPIRGTVFARGVPAPRITLRALRRPPPALTSWGAVAELNRSFSVMSDHKGHFSIAPDVGFYDFVFEPELGSYFPWKLWLDCPNGPGAGGALPAVELAAPVMLFGSVEAGETGIKLPGAKIEAFTIVDADHREPRSVMIGRAVSNERGEYMLALPPVVGEDTDRCQGDARRVKDNGRSTR